MHHCPNLDCVYLCCVGVHQPCLSARKYSWISACCIEICLWHTKTGLRGQQGSCRFMHKDHLFYTSSNSFFATRLATCLVIKSPGSVQGTQRCVMHLEAYVSFDASRRRLFYFMISSRPIVIHVVANTIVSSALLDLFIFYLDFF